MIRRHFIRWAAPLATALASLPPLVAAHAAAHAAAPATGSPVGNPVVLVVGDSLSAEYGLPRGSGWVALLQQRLAAEGVPATVVNASISGDTTAGGASRLPALLQRHRPAVVVVELGGNDALRGLPLDATQANLSGMVQAARRAGARALLLGMQLPPNYGTDYARRFEGLFAAVAQESGAALVPFLLKGVADAEGDGAGGKAHALAMFQPDGIHPVAAAQPIMLGNVWPALRPLLAAGRAQPPAQTPARGKPTAARP